MVKPMGKNGGLNSKYERKLFTIGTTNLFMTMATQSESAVDEQGRFYLAQTAKTLFDEVFTILL